ncbi:MAG TPA: hypothetical protein VE986_03000 [Hyphomicrobiales bacterium]|nr:hypothetical protein [Hyphomicrobiales bacterium]
MKLKPIQPLDPNTATPEDLIAALRQNQQAKIAGGVAGLAVLGVVMYLLWDAFSPPWESAPLWIGIIVGAGAYRLVYEFLTRWEISF